MTVTEWLRDPKTYTTSVLALLRDRWGDDFLQWEPATVELELKEFGITDPPAYLMDKILAGSSLFTSNLFFISLETFAATALTLNGNPVDASTLALPDLDDVMWAVTEARLLLGNTYKQESYGHDISRLVGVLLAEEGIYAPPEALKFAEFPEEEINNMAAYSQAQGAEASAIDAIVDFERVREASAELESAATKKLDELLLQLTQLPLKTRDDAFFQQLQVKPS